MNELDLIHEFGAETPLLSLTELSSARDVVTAGIAGSAAGEDRYAFPARRRNAGAGNGTVLLGGS
jgi:hypothetical protein